MKPTTLFSLFLASAALFSTLSAQPASGWLTWRGPNQNGTSQEKGLPSTLDPKNPLWVTDFPGQSTAVVANGHVYIIGYLGEGPDLQEGVGCFDAETGAKIWEHRYNDFLSDTIYLRYATSSPGIDPETGTVYMQGTQGILAAFKPDGTPVWSQSLMERLGRLTFPNSRTASPVIDSDLVITRGITSNWGANGAAGDRFYAFDKKTGELVWSSGTGERPKDNSYSNPVFSFLYGKRVFFSATGDGAVVCVNARTGETLWRVYLSKAGINATVLVHNNDKVVAVYGTPYEPGQMVCLKIPATITGEKNASGVVNYERSQLELWSADLTTSTSSPILVGDKIYVVVEKGDLNCVDIKTGKIAWHLKLGIEERNSCPVYADGKLYVPMLDDPAAKSEGGESGSFGALYIVEPGETEGKILAHVALEGRCFGTPTPYNGKVYMQTTKKLYCFGTKGNNAGLAAAPAAAAWPTPGPATQLQVIPSEFTLRPGAKASFRVRKLDANGFTVGEVQDITTVKWAPFIPATARVKAAIKGSFNEKGELVAAPEPTPSAGQFEASVDGLKGYVRGRVLPFLPLSEDFEKFQLSETTTNTMEPPTAFAYPPLTWIGARFKFEVRNVTNFVKNGEEIVATNVTHAMTKTTDNKFFQRAQMFIGDQDAKGYTIQADVMSEGTKRKMSDVGIINQRYLIVLKGNEQKLEVNSNLERLRVPAGTDAPNFKWVPNTWYRLKARVDNNPDGSGVVRAKAWKRDEPEPDKWSVEVPHQTSHHTGSPGLYGFSPQEMRVFIDNVKVTPNS